MKFRFIIEMDMSGHLSNNLIRSVVFFNKTAADWVERGETLSDSHLSNSPG